MPLYEYFCTACNTQSDISHRISDPPATDCPVCGASALTKLMSAAGFRLKGSGWYETDFKSGSKKNLAEPSGPAPASGGDAGGGCGAGGCGAPACATASTPAGSSASTA